MKKLISASYMVWQSSLLGACATAFGSGILLADNLSIKGAWLIIVLGVLLHGWGMYRMYKKRH